MSTGGTMKRDEFLEVQGMGEAIHVGPAPLRAEQLIRQVIAKEPDRWDDADVQADAFGGAHRAAIDPLLYLDILPRHQFLSQLKREKRRTDRSMAPLSIAVFRLPTASGTSPELVNRLLRLLSVAKRETDVIGYLEPGLVAVILTDTDEKGAECFRQKLEDQKDALSFTIDCATYPDGLFDHITGETETKVDGAPIFLDHPIARHQAEYPLKRLLDIVGALVAIVLTSPVMLITALAVRLTSSGPIIFKQPRMGKGGVPFVFYKFRSMYVNNDDRIHREYVAKLIDGETQALNQGQADKPMYKLKSDPRITPIGRFIRKTSIDELPQLFNVLKGEMSLVGPRPPIPYETEKYQAWHLRRVLEIRPGITGLWQVQGRSKTTFDEMVRMDLQYIRNCSLGLDLKIMLKTVKVVLKCDGAT
jgi:exopolysaccharide biosynthesis polyprenyl glycosylphosphotransferase